MKGTNSALASSRSSPAARRPRLSSKIDPYAAIDRQRQPHSYVENLERRGRTPAQARLRRRFLRFAKVGPGQRVLEVGSGSGVVARAAAALVGPRGQVVGADPSRVMTEAARRGARPLGFGRRLVHEVGDGAKLRFATGRFDRVFAVTVLLHVQDSDAILDEMMRVTRPGGILAVQDQDFGSLTLDHPDRALTTRIMDGVVARMYPDPWSGRTLFGRLARLGLRRVRLFVDVFQDTTLEPYTHAMLTRRALNAVRLGLASAGAAARWMAAVERLAASGQFAFTLNHYAARGVKPLRGLLAALFAAAALAAGDPAAAAPTKEVVVLTSFPKELFEVYKQAFEQKHPGVKMIVKQQQTNQGVTYLRETRARPEADIFWVSAVDAFQTLKADGLLDKLVLPKETLARMPAKVGGFPLHDPDGQYWGFAVSGYGLMWNTRYLALHKLPAPKEWTDLSDPRYFGHLSISAPSRSGTTHLTIEAILQAYGWEKGWALLMQMGGNMGAITERSFGVPEAVISGQLGIGVVIDFFGLSAIASGQPIGFAYPSLTAVVPASVAVVRNGPNPDNARAFVEYLLSDEGQLRLFAPEIGRLPVVPALYSRAPKGYPNPFTMKLGGIEFDPKLSSSRRNIVNALFDQIITFRHAELKAAWGAIYAAEAVAPKVREPGRRLDLGAAELAEARTLASTVPLDGRLAADKAFNAAFKDKPDVKSRLETEWDTAAKGNYANAKDRADQAARMR